MTEPTSPLPDITPGLMAAAEGDPELARELAVVFFEDMPERLTELRAAAAAGDVAKVGAAAHTLKGSAGALGFTDLADRALALELRARDGSLTPTAVTGDIVPVVEACMDAIRATRSYLGRGIDDDPRG